MKIKICGIRSKEDIELVNQYKPDYIGFIFYPPSPRFLSFEKAKDLKLKLTDNVKSVGVFVDEDVDVIIEQFKNGCFDIVQLHGDEDQKDIELLQKYGIPVIKAIKIKDKDSLRSIHEYDPDYFLFDIYDKKKVGGTGEKFNWELLKHYTHHIPFFLAGGLNHENIETAFEYNPHVLDISSGVETDYKKDSQKFKKLFKKYSDLNGE